MCVAVLQTAWQSSISSAVHRGVSSLIESVRDWDWFRHKISTEGLASPIGPSSNPAASTLNLVNGTLDAGILGLPLMMSRTGWLLGLIMLACVACLGVFTTRLMIMTGIAEKTQSYHMTVLRTLGKPAASLFQALLIAGTLGSLYVWGSLHDVM